MTTALQPLALACALHTRAAEALSLAEQAAEAVRQGRPAADLYERLAQQLRHDGESAGMLAAHIRTPTQPSRPQGSQHGEHDGVDTDSGDAGPRGSETGGHQAPAQAEAAPADAAQPATPFGSQPSHPSPAGARGPEEGRSNAAPAPRGPAYPPGSARPVEAQLRQSMAILAQTRCGDLGLSYEVVRDLVLALYKVSVSALSLQQQEDLFAWLQRPAGVAKYTRTAEVREMLLECAGDLSRKERAAAAKRAGVDTSPSTLTAPELMRLLEAQLFLHPAETP